jgi:D-glycero-D-manno-heptose 1,7-bisphosphate phosphatase
MVPALVLLDRDGTLNIGAPAGRYVTTAAEARLLPGAGTAVRRLNDAGAAVVVVTNQRGLATGALTREGLEAVHGALVAQLAETGARVDGWYVCPHDLGRCDCRKPLPGLLLQALADRPGVPPERSVVIGDAESDVRAGLAAGIPAVLLHPDPAAVRSTGARTVQTSLAAAVEWLLAPAGGPGPDTVTGR